MSRRIPRALVIAALLGAALAVAACGKSSGGGGSSSSGVKTGPGIADKTITLGVQTDLSGVFAALASVITQANQLYWKQQNAAGGVCGRSVKLIVKDHGYDPQTAVTQYRDISSDVAALQQVVGSPVSAALLPTWKRDDMLALLAAWPPTLLNNDNIGIIGASYDVEAINGIDWMMKNKGLKKGDKVGDLYFEGDYGEGGLIGVKYAAKQHGLTVVEQKIKATDTDMSGQISAFKRANVDAIWVTTGPKQLASAIGVAKAQGLNVPFGSNGPSFSPLLLKTPVGPVLEKQFTSFASTAPISLNKPDVQKAKKAYEKYYPKGIPQASVVAGWSEAEVMNQVLQKACDNKELTREGMVKAVHSIGDLDTGGVIAAPMDFTQQGQPSTKTVYVSAVDKSAAGGQKAIGGPYLGSLAKAYEESSSS